MTDAQLAKLKTFFQNTEKNQWEILRKHKGHILIQHKTKPITVTKWNGEVAQLTYKNFTLNPEGDVRDKLNTYFSAAVDQDWEDFQAAQEVKRAEADAQESADLAEFETDILDT